MKVLAIQLIIDKYKYKYEFGRNKSLRYYNICLYAADKRQQLSITYSGQTATTSIRALLV